MPGPPPIRSSRRVSSRGAQGAASGRALERFGSQGVRYAERANQEIVARCLRSHPSADGRQKERAHSRMEDLGTETGCLTARRQDKQRLRSPPGHSIRPSFSSHPLRWDRESKSADPGEISPISPTADDALRHPQPAAGHTEDTQLSRS